MNIKRCAILIIGFLLANGALASTRDALVVNAQWLSMHLADRDLVLLHVGDKAEYDARHIPGARLVSMSDVSVTDRTDKGLMLEMPAAEDLRHRLEALGISDKSRVVVYYGKDWVSPATRIIFTLDYAGLGDRTSLLDGGMGAWVRAGGAVTAEKPKVVAGTLAPLKLRPIVVDAAFVRSHTGAPGFVIVDGRAASFYDGVDTSSGPSGDWRTGHVHGAVSIPFTSVVDDQNVLKSPAELEAMFKAAGAKPSDTIVAYCHIGQQATAVLFAARTLGHPVLLYDGSFQDWSRRSELPVDNPARRGGC
jgi:thiosulfate/3-mercaptopyruvate sulfurtransferase